MSDDLNDESNEEEIAPDDAKLAREETERLRDDVEAEIFQGVRSDDGGPVLPIRLKPEDMFCFSCHKGVSCWNRCCYGADVTLTPYDILRLSRHFGIRPAELVAKHTVPAIWDRTSLPVAKLKMDGDDGKGPCPFLNEPDGCTVYEDRPATCRYYPLGLGAIKLRDSNEKMDFHFLVKESYCEGHDEEKLQSVNAFREEQAVEDYDAMNRGWIDILMKMASWITLGGPQGTDVSPQTKQIFYLVSTDVDGFRKFVFETRFLETYLIDPEVVERLRTDDEALLQLGFDWMKNVMFNEPTISFREEVLQRAMASTREKFGGS